MPLALWSVKVTFGESCIVCMGKVVWRVNYSYLYEYVAYESHIFYFIYLPFGDGPPKLLYIFIG